jgi:hypothetical protein
MRALAASNKRTKYIGLDIHGVDFVIEGTMKELICNKGFQN